MGNLHLNNDRAPIFSGAGVCKDEARIRQLAQAPLMAQIIGSFTEKPWAGNDAGGTKQVEYWDEPEEAYFNSIGLKNPGAKEAGKYLPSAVAFLHDMGQLAIISISTLKGENPDVVLPRLAAWALSMGADGVEVNGSCPNQAPEHPLLCNDTEATYTAIDAIRAEIGSSPYLMLKVSALPPALIERYRTEGKLNVDAIDTINTIGNQPSPTNPATGQPYIEVNDGLAGKSGPAIKGIAVANLEMWLGNGEPQNSSQPFDVWSIGGITDGFEAYRRIGMGALLAGGTQAFRRAADPVAIAEGWAKDYQSYAAR